MEYSQVLTEQVHPLRKYAEHLNGLMRIEGGKGLMPEHMFGINLDKVEKSMGRVPNLPTMDVAIGVSDGGKKKRMLLVELKLNCKNPNNLKREDFDGKIANSVQLISFEGAGIHTIKYFLFPNKCVNEAKLRIRRLHANRKMTECEILHEADFAAMFKENVK